MNGKLKPQVFENVFIWVEKWLDYPMPLYLCERSVLVIYLLLAGYRKNQH